MKDKIREFYLKADPKDNELVTMIERDISIVVSEEKTDKEQYQKANKNSMVSTTNETKHKENKVNTAKRGYKFDIANNGICESHKKMLLQNS